MKLECTATLRLCCYDVEKLGTTPQKITEEIYPLNCVRYEWIPQTILDQVWVWFEFSTAKEKENFIKNLPIKYQNITRFIATTFTQERLDYWANDEEEMENETKGEKDE